MLHNHTHKINPVNEKKTLIVILLTLITMAAEIVFGYITNSMALLADGFHMGTHALALGLTFAAYVLIRKFEGNPIFPNGTDKIGVLAAYTSSIFLGLTGVWIIFEAVDRFVNPLEINFNDAVIVAVIGLLVNTVCIFIMSEHKHCNHEEHCEDYNFKAAYFHILADALTSILAIIALLAGKFFNIVYLDSVIGILGGILIVKWSVELLKNTVAELIDMKRN